MRIGVYKVLIALLVSVNLNIEAQEPHIYNGIDLLKLFDRIRMAPDPAVRQQADDSLQIFIDEYVKSDTVFKHKFNSLRFLGQVTAPDSLMKIVTWNLMKGDGNNFYRCYVLYRSSKTEPHRVYKLATKYLEELPAVKYFTSGNWYGALYYDLRPFGFNGKKYYAVLGIDYGNQGITRKIIDVIDPSNETYLQFGLPCFVSGPAIDYRIVFRYASSAVMSVKFESDKQIVFDHLSPFSPEFSGNFRYYGPDFSFDSYTFENGAWRLKEDIDIKNRDNTQVNRR